MMATRIDSSTEPSAGTDAVLTTPLSLDGELRYRLEGQRQENIVTRILNLFKCIRPGSDLTKFQLPPQFNLPKSQLQLFGETVYCYSQDLLSKCAQGKTALERFNSVVAWSISTTRPPICGKAPYNPILGETHHVSSGNLNVLLEQVSHHPPVSALHATNESQKLELNWWHYPQPQFYGKSIEVKVHGKRELTLLEFGETYEMNCPQLRINLFPFPTIEWIGNVEIQCRQTGLKANLSYKGKSFFGLKGPNTKICGSIGRYFSPQDVLYELHGVWDGTVTLKNISTGNTSILYDAKEVISNLKKPIIHNEEGITPTESALVWSEVSKGILNGDWSSAAAAKTRVEEEQRNSTRQRESGGMSWIPKHFIRKGDGWDYLHRPRLVSPAPISVL
ncbi:hypothetical protein SUGI_0479480 [Cryptomeria japonica]|nr:hypothetical protein SUGI_0479480 [Cryptomeria japonica]